jgi:hypothetical protein
MKVMKRDDFSRASWGRLYAESAVTINRKPRGVGMNFHALCFEASFQAVAWRRAHSLRAPILFC